MRGDFSGVAGPRGKFLNGGYMQGFTKIGGGRFGESRTMSRWSLFRHYYFLMAG